MHKAVDGSTDQQRQSHADSLSLSAKHLQLLDKFVAHAIQLIPR